MSTLDPRLERIGRLAALARGLEMEGGYNGAKLIRAALERELLRYADATAPSGREALGDAVATVRRELDGDYPAAFGASLEAVEATARAGTTVPLASAPTPRTCRAWGELFLVEPLPSSCPTCESPATAFREHLPIWFLEPAVPADVLTGLAAGPRLIADALDGHEDADLARPPAPGDWSAREVLQQLLFAERLLAERVGRLLREDEPDLAARAVWAETAASDEGSVRSGDPAGRLFARYRELRAATVDRLSELDDAQWRRSGYHAEWDRVSVLSQAAYFARHQASHMAQLVAAADGRLPGQGH